MSNILKLLDLYRSKTLFPLSTSTGSRWMARVSHCCSNNSSWFHCKILTCRAELKLFKMWSPLSMSSAAFSTSWQPWFPSKERLPSGFTLYALNHSAHDILLSTVIPLYYCICHTPHSLGSDTSYLTVANLVHFVVINYSQYVDTLHIM